MRKPFVALPVLLLASGLLVTTGCGPVWMLPGGSLAGPVEPAPEDWSFSDATDVVQLETRPEDPYSVNIWGVGIGKHFYVAAGEASSSAWAANLSEAPDVRLKIGESVYELRAVRVEDAVEIEACLAALKRKYDFEPKPEQRSSAAVFRLEPRAGG